jgi:hypothetical protein
MGRNTADGIDEALGPGDLLWPFASPWCWVGPQPQRDVGRLHRLTHHPHQIVAQRELLREAEISHEPFPEMIGRTPSAITA